VFWRKTYDRGSALAVAEKARSRGRTRKAVRWYLKVLQHEPNDHQTNARVAPLLARVGRAQEARSCFDKAADGFLAAGFAPKAIAVWSVAAQNFPEHVEYWERIANQQVIGGRKQDAVLTLMSGRGRLRKKRQRPLAMLLLRQALALDPMHVDATLDLADLLRKDGARAEARRLLGASLGYVRARAMRRRVRFALFRIEPSFRGAVDWALAR
jgi:tetratricopeptide (TPR) repeat protein